MAKDKNSNVPSQLQDHQEAVKAEAEQVSAKIDEAFGKLTKKMRGRAEKAEKKMNETQKSEKRATLLRRYELYADAASYLEDRLPPRGD